MPVCIRPDVLQNNLCTCCRRCRQHRVRRRRWGWTTATAPTRGPSPRRCRDRDPDPRRGSGHWRASRHWAGARADRPTAALLAATPVKGQPHVSDPRNARVQHSSAAAISCTLKLMKKQGTRSPLFDSNASFACTQGCDSAPARPRRWTPCGCAAGARCRCCC